jgi:POT family proton-dependent oligopeptide transporter
MATLRPAPADAADRAFFGHPRGLATLFFTELWERFSFYGMRALLILFMTAGAATGGLGFGVAKAGVIYGLYASMVYLMSVPGGWIADRVIGQRRAVLAGGILIAAGQGCLALPSESSFYAGLALLVLGTGLLKPNVSTMVGQLYAQNDHRRDAGFSIFYMGINLGAFCAPLLVGYVGQRLSWHLGFLLAGIGMIFGLTQFWLGSRHLSGIGLPPPVPQRRSAAIGGAVLAVAIGIPLLLASSGFFEITAEQIAFANGLVLMTVTAGVFGWLFIGGEWTAVERGRLIAAAVLFAASALFFSAYEQAGSTLTLLADRSADNRVFGFAFPSSWYQSLPALFVIALAPAFAWLWVRLGRRDPSSPAKFSIALVLAGAGFVVASLGALRASSGIRISPLWLVFVYLLQVLGELCLSPVGLSVMTKLAPARAASLMMGVWFLAASIGDYIGGRFGSVYEVYTPASLFAIVAAIAIGLGMAMLLLVKPVQRLMSGIN